MAVAVNNPMAFIQTLNAVICHKNQVKKSNQSIGKKLAKTILVTGATGSFGKRFLSRIVNDQQFEKIILFSRDEYKQGELARQFPKNQYPHLKYILGDIRDGDRIDQACFEVDVVIHAAALKYVDQSDANPMEFVKTNILGTENLIRASIKNSVKKVIGVSTDKAVAPASTYGATKLCMEKLLQAASNWYENKSCVFSVIRYGNVIGARGSVIPYFLNKKKEKILPVTHPEMTRFHIAMGKEVDLALYALEKSLGGEIFVPKIPSYRVIDLVKAICPDCTTEIIGLRPGEKLHEALFTVADEMEIWENENYYILFPLNEARKRKEIALQFSAKKISAPFSYISATNAQWLNVEELKKEIADFVNSTPQNEFSDY